MMGVKSAERVFEILELIKKYPDGLIAKEVSNKLGYAASSTFELLKTMTDLGYLYQNESKRYTLGAKLIQLGAYASTQLDIIKIAQPVIKKLMDKVQETIFMAVLSDDEIIYIAKEDCHKSITTNARLGGKKPIYCTGLGKAFLSFLPMSESEQIIQRINIVPYTENTVRSKEELKEQLQTFRKQGYAIDNQEVEDGLWCASAPVYNSNGYMEAAISVSGPTKRMLDNKDMIVHCLLDASREISENMGYVCFHENIHE